MLGSSTRILIIFRAGLLYAIEKGMTLHSYTISLHQWSLITTFQTISSRTTSIFIRMKMHVFIFLSSFFNIFAAENDKTSSIFNKEVALQPQMDRLNTTSLINWFSVEMASYNSQGILHNSLQFSKYSTMSSQYKRLLKQRSRIYHTILWLPKITSLIHV